MKKPFTTEIIKLMAAHSDGAAAYASAMKWDWLRRQKVEDITLPDIKEDCALCKRYDKCNLCPLWQKGFGCHEIDSLYRKAENAYDYNDQQAFTQAANDLYYLIVKIIDDLYKPEPKKEVFYSKGQELKRCNGEIWTLTQTVYGDEDTDEDHKGVSMAALCRKGEAYSGSKIIASHEGNVTETELKEICGNYFGTFTLIEDKK